MWILERLAWWAHDARWMHNARRARKIRRNLSFGARQVFDSELRPIIDAGRIAYPDAFYHTTFEDFMRAYDAALNYREAHT